MYSYLYAYIYGIFFMADLDYVEIAKNLLGALLDMAKGGNSGPTDKTKSSASADTESPLAKTMGDAINKLGELAGAAGGAVIGLRNVRNAADAWSDAVTLMSKAAGEKLGEVIKYIDYNRQLAVAGAKVGVGDGRGVEAEGKAQKAGYKNLQEEIDAVGSMKNSARSFGNSAQDANEKFMKFGKELQSTELAGKLKDLGLVTAREIASMAQLAAGNKEELLNSQEGRKKLAEQTILQAQEVERQVRATSKSREAIMEEMLAHQASAEGIQQARSYRNDAERSAANDVRLAASGMGNTMANITSTIMAGGYLDKTKRTELQVATGGRAGQYMAAVRDQRRTANMADNDPQKIAAKERFDREVALANAYQTSKQFQRRAMTTQDPMVKAASDKFTLENTEAGRQRAIMNANPGMSAVDARKELLARGDTMISGGTAEGYKQPMGAPGTVNEGARTAQVLQGGLESLRKNAASTTGELAKLNDEFARTPDLMNKVRTGTTIGGAVPSGMTQDQSDANAKKNINTLNPFKSDPASVTDANTPGAIVLKKKEPKAEGQRAHGTLGETGSPTEPKDIVAKLHKGETVATPEQLRNLMSGSASNAISELMKSATSKTTPTAPTGNIDISKITSGLKEITTTISSVSGGGSTTRSTVENDDAKAAKKELEAIKSQFQTEKNDIRSQVKSNLGPDAKGMDVIRAMRDNPQAKALEARIQEATAKLSTRISAGTSIDTKVEPGINRTSIKDMISENSSESAFNKLASIKDNTATEEPISNKLTSTKDDTETEEPEEIAQPKEEIKFEEQSNKVGLEDLNEQLIQLNTSIRQLIQHSAESVETAGRQIKATKSLSGNRFA